MDERLSRSNRLPGSEKLTRPEEIGQLSKYLKSIKEVYEESTRLEDQVLGVSGYSTGKIPEINSLGDKTVKAPENQGEHADLSQKILGVPGKRWEEKLSEKRLNLKDPRTPELETSTVKTPDNHGGEVDRLGEVIKKIQDVRDQELEEKRLNLLDERQIALEDTRLDLQAMINASLENKRIDLKDNRETKLEDTKLNLTDPRQPELEDKRLNLKDERNPKLSDKIIELKELKEVRLEDKRLGIQDERENSLETKRIDLSAEENIELEDKRVDIEGPKEIGLEDKRLDLSDSRQNKLEDKRIDIENLEEPELENKRLDLENEKTLELETTRFDLTDKRELELSNKRLDIEDDRFLKLGDTVIEIRTELSDKIMGLDGTRSEPSELEDKRIDLEDDRENELSDKRLDLKDNQVVRLGDKRIDIRDENDPSLSDKILGLNDDREQALSDKRLNLKDERETSLEDKRLDLNDPRENVLADKRLNLEDERENELEDKRLDLVDERENSLSDKILELTDNREPELEDKRIDLTDERENELENKRLDLDDQRENELEDKRIDLEDNRENNLSDKILELEDSREDELEDKRLDLEDDRENSLSDKILGILENENGEPTELYDSFIGAPENENGEPTELYDAFLGMAENQGGEVTELEDKIVGGIENQSEEVDSLENKRLDLEDSRETELEDKRLDIDDQRDTNLSDKILGITENQGTAPDITDINIESIRDYTAKLSDAELYEFAMKIASEGENASGEHNGWLEKVSGLMSSYLSSDILTPKRAIEFRDAINNTLEMSYFGSQAALRVPVDTSSGTTWAKAEEAVGEQITGTNRRDALDEMIVKIVDYKRSNLPRLPGSDLADAALGAIKNVVGSITGGGGHPNPVNKPLHMNGVEIPGGYGDTLYQAANNRTTNNSIDIVGDTIGTVFYDRYWSSKSFKMTLEDLCPILGKAPIASLAELKTILKSSPYITTPGKFMTDTKGSYNTQTLDTNMYWEVVIEPFCCFQGPCSNGGFSYLPSIQEINLENELYHKVRTRYGLWAPINGFELQKSKLVTKSLQLYEGEISYPTGMEFTNELRLTFVDDSWKSWRRYFEKCAQVAIYNSTPHLALFYATPTTEEQLTRIDKENVCVAPYKNLAFNIRIYILSPQLNTIRKYSLLCVLKDFSEEYAGEIDSGGADLNVSFSIVGENPETNTATNYLLIERSVIESITKQATLEAQKRISNAINSSIGLL